ncbi:MAG: phosphate ABC transporter permease, partial [Prochloraceae cyanobacterium]
MLVPLTREKFEQMIPSIATGPQYAYYWGKFPDLLRRILISVVGIIVVLFLRILLGRGASALMLLLGIIVGLYWLWGPVYWASLRNNSYRRFRYSGFWRGRVLDVFVTEELVGEEQTVNERGELVIVENRERRINLEVG